LAQSLRQADRKEGAGLACEHNHSKARERSLDVAGAMTLLAVVVSGSYVRRGMLGVLRMQTGSAPLTPARRGCGQVSLSGDWIPRRRRDPHEIRRIHDPSVEIAAHLGEPRGPSSVNTW
jgi:hypothetical protein